MVEYAHYEIRDRVAFIVLDHPPVNAFCWALRKELMGGLARANQDVAVRAVVLRGAGRGFSAGGDLRELGTPALTAEPGLVWQIHAALDAMRKPVVAALHGLAIGGGLETALACHAQVAVDSTSIGLPEVGLGIIPLVATQRLPRLLGLRQTLDLILGGQKQAAREFSSTPLFDQLVAHDAQLEPCAAVVASNLVDRGPPFPTTAHVQIADAAAASVLSETEARLAAAGATRAQQGAVQAVRAAVEAPDFESGLKRAYEIFQGLLAANSAQSSSAKVAKPAVQ